MSAETKALIDAEVSRLVQGAYTRAKQLLLDNRQALDKLATMLVEKETVTAEEFAQILNDSTVSVAPAFLLSLNLISLHLPMPLIGNPTALHAQA